MIKVILWDVDGTLLNFKEAEKAAIRSLFKEFSFGTCTDEDVETYSAINREFWKKIERGEVEKKRALVGRFEEFFKAVGIDPLFASRFNDLYQIRLGDTVVFNDDSFQIVQSLQGKVKQYVVSNGTIVAQTKKLARSGLGKLMDGIFLSEEVGAEKPDLAFFRKVFQEIGDFKKDEILIVGDSVTGDIAGGNVAKIKTCLYAPQGMPVLPDDNEKYIAKYIVTDLHEIYDILNNENEIG